MKLTHEEVTARAWEMVRQGHAPSERALQEWISAEVHRRLNANQPTGGFTSYSRVDTGPDHHELVRDVLWSLVLARVIRPGESGHGRSMSWDQTKLIGSTQTDPLPADPTFLSGLTGAGLASATVMYVQHAIRALPASPTAAMSMLGNANELLVDELISAFAASSFASSTLGSKLEKQWQISQRFKIFKAELDPQAKQLLRDAGVSDGSDTFITAAFDHIRLDRNEAGHPSGREFEAGEVQGNLLLFRVHALRCLALTRYLQEHSR